MRCPRHAIFQQMRKGERKRCELLALPMPVTDALVRMGHEGNTELVGEGLCGWIGHGCPCRPALECRDDVGTQKMPWCMALPSRMGPFARDGIGRVEVRQR